MVARLENRQLICTIYKRIVYPRSIQYPHRRFEGPNWSGRAFVVAFANVDCSVYATGPIRATVVGSLRTIFRRFGATAPTAGTY
jgi:hypothetical protein